MKNIKKFGLLLALIASVSLSSCSSEQSLTKPDTTTSTAEDSKKDTAADTQENKKEDTDKKEEQKEDKKENTDKKEDTQKDDQQLTDDEKATIDEFVERLEKYEIGTAGASLKMDRLFTEIVNRCEFLETKPEQSQQYFIKKVSEVKDTENFKMAVKALKNTIDYYKEDKQAYIKQLEDSGAEWNPQIKLETLENLVNKF
ncbi:hypothetical protein [Finegoldia magna]|uniref:hypothetical protein n=1 Tax=Finegoldia magna TaxID=1260 RepID=UPI000B91BA91|nr:hypothetical protein [Finegoldia magna]MDU1831526.1 hypothetical protein [Finegoldia magna]MDU1877999.1 hypothetical protein [Finegoldia magna]MDU2131787.1 hypothetical protein [Finegoldia magna]MDU4278321.1 hypothetical protein [Finegoldia magna]MDU5070545.1 hypothetical protein [Finegoldia magna]